MTDNEFKILSIDICPLPDLVRINKALGYYRHLVDLQKYVETRWKEPFTLTEVANEIGISPSRLSHLFLEKTGITFRGWVCYERVKRAAILLSSSELSNWEVASSSGFGSKRAFERTFRNATGISPSKYRKQQETQLMAQP